MFVSYSSLYMGLGVIAGGPYYCAQDNLAIALSTCMKDPELIEVTELEGITRATALSGFIDGVDHMKTSRVFILHGSQDIVVKQGVGIKLESFFKSFITAEGSVASEFSILSGHGIPTLDYGAPCNSSNSPYILKCIFDGAGSIFGHVYKGKVELSRSSVFDNTSFAAFDQTAFFHLPVTAKIAGFDDTGYVYVPKRCSKTNSGCPLHVVLHGCRQGFALMGATFMQYSGYVEWAEGSGIVLLFPQAIVTDLNPDGCWDWWGFSGTNYAAQLGLQSRAVFDMVSRILQ
jgi:poly(3-hydroxybutyrate) depolymerase